MNKGVGIWRCLKCKAAFFPERLLCSRCHGHQFEPDRIYKAVVEEVSIVRHMLGETDWQPRRIASVRTAEGQRITVGLRDEFGARHGGRAVRGGHGAVRGAEGASVKLLSAIEGAAAGAASHIGLREGRVRAAAA